MDTMKYGRLYNTEIPDKNTSNPALYELYIGVQNSPEDNIAHFAHLGGALFGFLLIKSWRSKGLV